MRSTAQKLALDRRVGSTLCGKWRIDALLGVGGVAAVYSATHRNGKRVGIKILHAHLVANEDTRTRFVREGYVANRIKNPGAVEILDDDVGEDGAPFLVMELLEGETIDQRSDRHGGRLPVDDVLAIADKLLGVLAAAHDKGIIHRDIKPENLFLTREGQLKVLDFGLARLREIPRHARQTADEGTVMGTPAFLPPEQAAGRWDAIDERTDIWALGATMFTLISGRLVHDGVTPNQLIAFTITRPANSLRSVWPATPVAVSEVVDRALSFEKSNRFANARLMRAAVREAYKKFTGQTLTDASQLSVDGAIPSIEDAETIDTARAGTTAVSAARTGSRGMSRESYLRLAAVLAIGCGIIGAAIVFVLFRTPRAPQAPPPLPSAIASTTSAEPAKTDDVPADPPLIQPEPPSPPSAKPTVEAQPKRTSEPAKPVQTASPAKRDETTTQKPLPNEDDPLDRRH